MTDQSESRNRIPVLKNNTRWTNWHVPCPSRELQANALEAPTTLECNEVLHQIEEYARTPGLRRFSWGEG